MATIGERIRSLRTTNHLTQTDFGKIFGIGKTTVSSYETGYSCPNDDIKLSICKYFNISMDYLLGLQDGVHTSSPFFSGFVFSFDSTENIANKIKPFDLKQIEKKTNISFQRLSNFVEGVSYPSPDELKKLSYFLNCSVDDLISGQNKIQKRTEEENEIIELFSKLPIEKKKLVIDLIKNLSDK